MNDRYFIGIDVGTGSARAGIFNQDGALLANASRDIELFREGSTIVEQSSDNIWSCICKSVREALSVAKVSKEQIKGIGFDATCSLVVLDQDTNPLSVSTTGNNERNIIVWMDHRATDQAERINATQHRVLNYVGGKISPEMETPKLLWLKENMPDIFQSAGHFFDLTDYLTWRCTGDLARSVCTVTCKWTFMAHENSWDKSYFDEVGLSDLAANSFARIGSRVVDPGTALGQGLTEKAAMDLGLATGTPVAAGLIDAHAGGVGTVGAVGASPSSRMAYVFGTSACTMSSSKKEAFVPGVWGPYYSAMVPGLWLSEGGQSAAGEAIAHLLKLHPAYLTFKQEAEDKGHSLPNYLLMLIDERCETSSHVLQLAQQIVTVPEFLGNRAPFADPEARAVISGLDLNTDIESLIGLYVSGIVGLGYGLRQILDVQTQNGVSPDTVVMSGGAGESPIVKQLLADAANITIAGPGTKEPVLLGSAMLGAVASGEHTSLISAMGAMSTLGDIFHPTSGEVAEKHTARFKAFEALQKAATLVRDIV
ncbi:FGGY carbohydrate kinase domain-containing protein [Nymphon striatum]|nr:FGGY carbohydrate kinase domain-containing protein [Nymphon striatum]